MELGQLEQDLIFGDAGTNQVNYQLSPNKTSEKLCTDQENNRRKVTGDLFDVVPQFQFFPSSYLYHF